MFSLNMVNIISNIILYVRTQLYEPKFTCTDKPQYDFANIYI